MCGMETLESRDCLILARCNFFGQWNFGMHESRFLTLWLGFNKGTGLPFQLVYWMWLKLCHRDQAQKQVKPWRCSKSCEASLRFLAVVPGPYFYIECGGIHQVWFWVIWLQLTNALLVSSYLASAFPLALLRLCFFALKATLQRTLSLWLQLSALVFWVCPSGLPLCFFEAMLVLVYLSTKVAGATHYFPSHGNPNKSNQWIKLAGKDSLINF